MTKNTLAKRYDHILIGYNTASMSLAYELAKAEKSFCLLDSIHTASRPVKTLPGSDALLSCRVAFNPADHEMNWDEHSHFFGQVTPVAGPPTTFEKGEFKSFLGFGEDKITAMDAVLPYCATESLEPQESLEGFWSKALPLVEEQIFLDQQITDMTFAEGQVESITLNGKTTLKGENFYFFAKLPFLFDQVGQSEKKLASQFGKGQWYSSTNLVIQHQSSLEGDLPQGMFLLMGSKKQPCLGQFTQVDGHLVSRWESFIPAELTPDSETTGTSLKEIKKQVKRAFGDYYQPKDREQILVHDQVYADLNKTSLENGKLGHFNNLFIYSPLLMSRPGWLYEVLLGQEAANSNKVAPEKILENPANEVAAPSTPC